eukprot:TRINITY_DN4498_c1_g1_i1.p1 TRINITY_DN4498_c1_g1~~TRINITY_DN4498_c1_g1_i1.p1  ORF type:complete len:558 (-),score=72.46 TRINITY_DN4498_c1_g1_i1:104-1690(-)
MAAVVVESAAVGKFDVVAKLKESFMLNGNGFTIDMNAVFLFAVSIMCIVLPLEVGQVTFALVGAAVYAGVQTVHQSARAKLQEKANSRNGKPRKVEATERRSKPFAREALVKRCRPALIPKAEPLEYRQASAQPVMAPTFCTNTFHDQVQELANFVKPSPQSEKVMRALAATVKRALEDLLPDAEVMAFANGDVMRGTAFGVAVPEVEIVLSAEPNLIAERLRVRTARPIPRAAQLDAQKLQKSALRACTDELVASGVFKFRRSAFKGMEPKVTFLVSGFGNQAIPVDFSVNTVAPFYNAALLTECAQIDIRASDLILSVRRWAKDRGVSHAAKGHLSPYAWTLLVIYFMQVRDKQDGPTLTKLKSFAVSSEQRRIQHKVQQQGSISPANSFEPGNLAEVTTVAVLLQGFFYFYARVFDWRGEAVCVRSGKRAPPSRTLPLHIVVREDSNSEVAPSIEDPFEPTKNLGSMMTDVSLSRMRAEIERADRLCAQSAPLSKLLEPWIPPERSAPSAGRALEMDVECNGNVC